MLWFFQNQYKKLLEFILRPLKALLFFVKNKCSLKMLWLCFVTNWLQFLIKSNYLKSIFLIGLSSSKLKVFLPSTCLFLISNIKKRTKLLFGFFRYRHIGNQIFLWFLQTHGAKNHLTCSVQQHKSKRKLKKIFANNE